MNQKPVALIILDGWGLRGKRDGNAVVLGETPNYDRWTDELERSILDASGEAVGLPEGQMGNSEVGHLNLGAGRVVYQDLTRINLAIKNETFFEMDTMVNAIKNVRERGGKLHLIGLLGDGGVHSHSDHLVALLELAERHDVEPVLHLITDGRDTPAKSGLGFVEKLESYLEAHPGIVASVSGRYYTMDRDKRWQRTQQGYNVIVNHEGVEGRSAKSASAALQQSYQEDTTDEFVKATAIETDKDVKVESGDCIIFYNFRADRMRQMVTILTDQSFDGFERPFIKDLTILTMTEYDPDYPVEVIFPDQAIKNTLAAVLSKAGRKQFHAAETEKYAHVTYFFNGGIEQQYDGEERFLAQSPDVATYDLKPEMSANELTSAVLQRIKSHDDDFILVNYANPDMVGHTGVLDAAIKAVETVDACAGRLVDAVVEKGGVALVTADHGNCDRMINHETGEPHTYHTTQPVPFFVIGDGAYINLRPRGILADVAPTVLQLLGIDQPEEMMGMSLIGRE